MVLPAVLLYAVFVIYPLIRGGWISLHQWDGISSTMTYIGFRNYRYAVDDPIFWKALRNTFQYAIGVTIAKNLLGLGLALLLNHKLRGLTFFRTAGFVPLRLPYGLGALFDAWLERHFPDRREKVLNRVREMRGGKLNDPDFGSRMRGEGELVEQIRALFHVTCRKLGLNRERAALSTAAFRRPPGAAPARVRVSGQMELF